MYGTRNLAQLVQATYLQSLLLSPLNFPVSMCSVHPGGVQTNIFRSDTWPLVMKLGFLFIYPGWCLGMRNSEQGSRNTLYCAVAPIGEHHNTWGGAYVPGAYHANMKPHTTSDVNGQSTNPLEMEKLYKYSLKVLNLKNHEER
eukprot:220447_1